MAKVDLLTEHHTAHIIIEGLTTIIPLFLRFGRRKEFRSLLKMSIAMLFDEMLRGGSDVNALEWVALHDIRFYMEILCQKTPTRLKYQYHRILPYSDLDNFGNP